MKRQDKSGDRTRIRASSQDTKFIPARYSASIVIIKGHAEGMEYPLTKAYTVIGRSKDADISIKDDVVSREHAAIVYGGGKFVLKDLESTNGTFVNGGLVQQIGLRHRDTFRIGDTTIQFILIETGSGKVYEVREEDE